MRQGQARDRDASDYLVNLGSQTASALVSFLHNGAVDLVCDDFGGNVALDHLANEALEQLLKHRGFPLAHGQDRRVFRWLAGDAVR